jgi:hypothetical protein
VSKDRITLAVRVGVAIDVGVSCCVSTNQRAAVGVGGLRLQNSQPSIFLNANANGDQSQSLFSSCGKIKKKQEVIVPPKMKTWSIDVEMKMIQEIESRPVLWDVTSSFYKRADLKPAAWVEVADVLGIPLITGKFL